MRFQEIYFCVAGQSDSSSDSLFLVALSRKGALVHAFTAGLRKKSSIPQETFHPGGRGYFLLCGRTTASLPLRTPRGNLMRTTCLLAIFYPLSNEACWEPVSCDLAFSKNCKVAARN